MHAVLHHQISQSLLAAQIRNKASKDNSHVSANLGKRRALTVACNCSHLQDGPDVAHTAVGSNIALNDVPSSNVKKQHALALFLVKAAWFGSSLKSRSMRSAARHQNLF